MKKLFLLFGLFCLASLGFSTGDLDRYKTPKATSDVNVFDITKNKGTALVYQTYKEAVDEFEKESSLKMLSPEAKKEGLTHIPAGGRLLLYISRSSIIAANTQWFLIVVEDPNGKEVFRKELDDDVPEFNQAAGITIWWNIGIAYLPESLPTGSKVYVVDSLNKNKHEYLIKND